MVSFRIAHEDFKVGIVAGRYITPDQIFDIYSSFPDTVKISYLGESVEGRPIYKTVLGEGSRKILMWSHMHGNESTSTKAVLDLINFLSKPGELSDELLNICQFQIIGMLNPDGAKRYTRENALGIDLNRDAKELTQPESRILRTVYEEFKPDFCFNLHDQRTLYNVGNTSTPATLSFLAPASDPKREIDASREASMQIIAAINKEIQKELPSSVGRYDDSFNPNCIGDYIQMQGTSSILIEAGHYPEDYEREVTRMYFFQALVAAITAIARDSYQQFDIQDYFNIPENGKKFFDILIKNVELQGSESKKREDIGIQFREELHNGQISFVPFIQERGELGDRFGHKTYDFQVAKDREFVFNSDFGKLLKI
ncbi:MAG: peptidase M14 [Eudoraea sp.]|nr:peptidase M14 [Eudoraea sp.]NNJ40951.1 peptidase M14 [Eudoraea sp.]